MLFSIGKPSLGLPLLLDPSINVSCLFDGFLRCTLNCVSLSEVSNENALGELSFFLSAPTEYLGLRKADVSETCEGFVCSPYRGKI